MKASIEQTELLKSMARVQSIVEKRTTIPILSNVLLEAKESFLYLRTFFCHGDKKRKINPIFKINIGRIIILIKTKFQGLSTKKNIQYFGFSGKNIPWDLPHSTHAFSSLSIISNSFL